MKALVFDDRKLNAGITRLLLKDLGIEAEACSTWEEAERKLRTLEYDVVLLDYYLSRGETALDMIPKIRDIGDICIITFSGSSKEQMIRDSMRAGADDFIDKELWQDRKRFGNLIRASVRAHSDYQMLERVAAH